MKKITALLLALVMILPLCLAACDGNTNTLPPTGDEGDSTTDAGNDSPTTNAPVDPDAPYVYTPDPDALYSGFVGVGANGSAVEFDSVEVTNRTDKQVLVENDFTGTDPLAGWTFATAVGGSWAGESAKDDFAVADPAKVVVDTADDEADEADEAEETDTAAEEDADKVLAFTNKSATGSMAYFGDSSWNYIQFKVKARLTEEGGDGFVLYFCVKDDKNYNELIVGDKGNTYVTLNTVADGTKTKAGEFLFKLHTLDADNDGWTTCTITFEKESIKVFVGGKQLFDLYAEEETVENPLYGGVGLGMWATAVSYDNLKITSNDTGKTLYENNFENVSSLEDDFEAGQYGYDGAWGTMANWLDEWVIVDDDAEHGKVLSMTNATPTGDAIMISESIDNEEWTNITIDVDARIDTANEGWLIVFNAKDVKDNIFWNIGGWGNTVTCFQTVASTGKSGQLEPFTSAYTTGQWYHITLVVTADTVYGYIDGYLMTVYTPSA